MRYHESCRHFKTKHWQTLWQSNITSLGALKDSAKSYCTFVAVDFEGLSAQENEPLGITDIGIAVLPFPPAMATSTPVPDDSYAQAQRLRCFFEQNTIECHWLRLKGKRQFSGPKDTCYFGQLQEVEPAQTEAALLALFKSIQERFSAPLVLVGFDLGFEFTTIASHLSQIFQFFSSWVDLQEIVTAVSKTKITYGLRDTLRAFGFPPNDLAIHGRKSGHNPADDTIRELAVLVNLLRLHEDATLQIPQKKRDGARKFWYGRAPGPKELYPFTTRVYIQGKPLSSILPHWDHLFDFFSVYDPVAVGISSTGKYGWVSLCSLEGLHRFIEDVHEKELKGEVWIVVSKYDPLVVPMTSSQLCRARQAARKAEQEKKQLERRLRREAESDQ